MWSEGARRGPEELAVADVRFLWLLDIKATMKSTGKVLIAPPNSVGLLLQG